MYRTVHGSAIYHRFAKNNQPYLSIFSIPPIYGFKTSGRITEPSCC
jgi:hypothetical protein